MGLNEFAGDPVALALTDAVYRAFPYPVLLITDTGQWRGANTQACAFFGCTLDSLLHAPLSQMAPVVCGADVQLCMRELAPGQTLRLADVWQVTDSMTVPVDITIAKVGSTLPCIYVVCAIPVNPQIAALAAVRTELHERNNDLKRVRQELHFANAMQARFLSTVSHELRTPLHTLLGYVRLALGSSAGELHAFLEVAERSGRQLATQISDLLRFNRSGVQGYVLAPALVCLPELLAQLTRSAKLMAVAARNRFHTALADDLPMWVSTDAARLSQVLENLLSNAFKYTSDGDVTLRVETLSPWSRTGQHGSCTVRFIVSDTGTGISEHELSRIFDPFVRSPQAHFVPGLGLGLAIARQWVCAFGGDIVVASQMGVGSTFSFDLALPLRANDMASHGNVEAINADLIFNQPAHAPTVMVVDDVDENRMLLRRVCERWGCHVVEAESAAQALAYVSRPGVQVDAYMLDQCMPVLDGWALLRRLRQTRTIMAAPIAMVSASPPQRPADFPAYLAFDLFLEKPLDTGLLRRFLSERLAHFPQAAVQVVPVSPSMPQSLPASFVVSVEDWEHLRHLLHMGRVVRIADWARKKLSESPVVSGFLTQLIGLAEAADLIGLGRLINPQRSATNPDDL